MDQSFLSLTCWATLFKTIVIYRRRDTIRELFRIHSNLSSDIRCKERYNRTVRLNYYVHAFLTCLYSSGVTSFAIQTVVSSPEQGLYPSTAFLPYHFAQNRAVYLSVLAFQILVITFAVEWTILQDSLYIALINIICCHLAELKDRLRTLGNGSMGDEGQDSLFYKDLIVCCERYRNCLR